MTTIEKLLPYIISLVLPGLNILSNNPFNEDLQWNSIIPSWLVISFFLVLLWKMIEQLLEIRFRSIRWISIILGSSLFIVLFLGLTHYFLSTYIKLPHKEPIWVVGIRLSLATVLYAVIIGSIRSVKEREKFRTENLSLQSENLKAQLNQLRQQVNPHFLFNCLSTLRSMVRSHDSQSEEYILRLSDVYRQILQNRESTVVSLQEELEFLQSYIYLMKLRHEDALNFDIHISDESLQLKIPIFSLQLLIENCIKHNIASESKPLYIRLFQNNLNSITISNNYQPKKSENLSFGLGTDNLRARYELLGLKDGVQIMQNDTEYSTTLQLI